MSMPPVDSVGRPMTNVEGTAQWTSAVETPSYVNPPAVLVSITPTSISAAGALVAVTANAMDFGPVEVHVGDQVFWPPWPPDPAPPNQGVMSTFISGLAPGTYPLTVVNPEAPPSNAIDLTIT